jgi:glc operon protein GlcG
MLQHDRRSRTSTPVTNPMMARVARSLVLALVAASAASALTSIALGAQAAPSAAAASTGATVSVPTLTFEGARRIAAAAAEEAQRNNWGVSIAVVDTHGELLFFARLDGAHQQSVDIARTKARTAARWRRETKALEDAVAGGRTVLLAVDGMLPLEGGVPIIVDGRVLGAVGVSGVTSQQDAQIAKAGIRAVFPQ